MPVEFKWVVIVKAVGETHPQFHGSCRSQKDAREVATNYIKGMAPGAVATVLEMREVLSGSITIQMDAA